MQIPIKIGITKTTITKFSGNLLAPPNAEKVYNVPKIIKIFNSRIQNRFQFRFLKSLLFLVQGRKSLLRE